ncbi:transcription factor bHLH95-like, partial [Neltuma alba]|uniref:transcription factor bHLH95-like n=1 Tax=Neltuma alba TaxID=207710 RepID=UPI0010A4B35F
MSANLSNSDNTTGEISSVQRPLRQKRDISKVDGENHHTSLERERRKKIRLHLRELQDLVPSVHHIRADQATIVEETIKYIKTLEDVVEKLEKIKRERLQSASNNNSAYPTASQGPPSMATAHQLTSVPQNPIGFQTWVFPNVVVNICGEEGQFRMCYPNKPDLYGDIVCVLHKYNIQVLCVTISTDDYKTSYKIQARANKQNSDQFQRHFQWRKHSRKRQET